MSMPFEDHKPVDDGLIDQLVDGELPDVERHELLRELEAVPDGWRRCALAFLEVQSWREALAPLAASARVVVQPVGVSDGHDRKPKPWRRVARLMALAGGIAAAFALGWALHGGPAQIAPFAPLARMETAAPAASSEPFPPAAANFAVRESPRSRPSEPAAPLGPVVKRWEQRGYRAETQKLVVSMELKDGRRLNNVPVHEVRLQYVGGRIY
jgi:hypothetical protein